MKKIVLIFLPILTLFIYQVSCELRLADIFNIQFTKGKVKDVKNVLNSNNDINKRQSCSCGLPTTRNEFHRQSKIIGGGKVPISAFPWQVNIEINRLGNWTHYCGGVLISEHHVLTAAHCVEIITEHPLRIVVGDEDLEIKEKNEQHFLISDSDLIMNKNYGIPTENSNDIALIRVRNKRGEGVKCSETVSPICLPKKNQFISQYQKCIVSGWGKELNEYNAKEYTRFLKAANIEVHNFDLCGKLYNSDGNERFTKNDMICAGKLNGGLGTCSGDSGGPLACKGKNGYFLLGLVSWALSGICAGRNNPTAFARVPHFLDWIESNKEIIGP